MTWQFRLRELPFALEFLFLHFKFLVFESWTNYLFQILIKKIIYFRFLFYICRFLTFIFRSLITEHAFGFELKLNRFVPAKMKRWCLSTQTWQCSIASTPKLLGNALFLLLFWGKKAMSQEFRNISWNPCIVKFGFLHLGIILHACSIKDCLCFFIIDNCCSFSSHLNFFTIIFSIYSRPFW